MRIIHTSDIHLDISYAMPGLPPGFGARRRQGLRDVLQDIVSYTIAQEANALFVAGDLFDHERVAADTLAFVKGQFERLEALPAFIAPGNHDPYLPGSPYAREAWPQNVRIFRAPEWTAVEVPGTPLTVHGFGFDGPAISRNPFGRLQIPNDGRLHVGIAHGSEMNNLPPGQRGDYAPFTAALAACRGLRYLAMGHYHVPRRIDAPFDTCICYSGAPEGHDFGETGPRCFMDVTVNERGVEVKEVPSSRTLFMTETLDAAAYATSHEAVEAIRNLAHGHAAALAVRVTLEGAPGGPWYDQVPAIRDAAAPPFEHLEVADALELPEDLEALSREETSLGAFVQRIREELPRADERRRRVLQRACAVGLAAYRGRPLPIEGVGEDR